MKHMVKVDFNSFDSDQETLEIIVKISSANIIKTVLKSLGETAAKEYTNVNLTVVTDQILNQAESSILKYQPTEKEYIDALMNEEICLNGYGSYYNLVTLRSSVTKFYHYIFNHLFLLSSSKKLKSSITDKNKNKNYIIVDDENDAYSECKLKKPNMRKYTSGYKNKNIDKWNSKDFDDYIQMCYKEFYGHDMIAKNGDPRKTQGYKQVGIKKILMPMFDDELKLGNAGLKEYIDWLFLTKAGILDYPISFGFIVSRKVVNNWLFDKQRGKQNLKNNKAKIKW